VELEKLRSLDHLLLNVVGWKHSDLSGALDSTRHPTAVDGVHFEDQVTLGEAHLVGVLGFVVVESSVDALEDGKEFEWEVR
jgi:hypothetical protein